MPQPSNRIVFPPDGWTNPFTATYQGMDRFGNGQVYDAAYGGAALLQLIYDARDDEITVRCLLCPQRAQAAGRFLAYPMVSIVSVNATELLIPMNTPRITRHLAATHDITLDGIDDVSLFNGILDCCGL